MSWQLLQTPAPLRFRPWPLLHLQSGPVLHDDPNLHRHSIPPGARGCQELAEGRGGVVAAAAAPYTITIWPLHRRFSFFSGKERVPPPWPLPTTTSSIPSSLPGGILLGGSRGMAGSNVSSSPYPRFGGRPLRKLCVDGMEEVRVHSKSFYARRVRLWQRFCPRLRQRRMDCTF